MPNYKLTYFNLQGFGEGARLIFAYAGVAYDDVRIAMSEWSLIKPTMPYFQQMPLLEVDGVIIPQSAAINRYLGRQFGLVPECPIRAALVDAVYDAHKDFFNEIKPFLFICYGKLHGDKEKQLTEVAIPARNKYFCGLRQFFKQAKNGYLVGDSLSWADIVIADHLNTIAKHFTVMFDDGYADIQKFVNRILAIPSLKHWIDKRPSVPF